MSDDPKAIAPSPPRILTRAEKRLAVIQRADERIRRTAQQIAEYDLAAAQIDDHGPPGENGVPTDPKRPEGWSDMKFRVARDARQPVRSRPGYVADAIRILESYQKTERDRPPAPQLNVNVANVTIHNHAAPSPGGEGSKYPVIDVTGRDGRR